MTNAELLPCVEIEPEVPARACVIWLHGLGADGHDFEPLVPHMKLPHVRFVFPNAPAIPITIPTVTMMPTDQIKPVSQVLRPSPSSVSVTPCFQPMTIRPARSRRRMTARPRTWS